MRQVHFSPEVVSAIEHDSFHHADVHVQRRMEVLWLKAHDQPHALIASLAGLSRPSVQWVLDRYESGGLEAVRTLHWKIPTSALAEHRQLLAVEFTAHGRRSL